MFFLLSGYTSNFEKNSTEFIWSRVKTLLLPLLCFGVLMYITDVIWFGQRGAYTFVGNEKYFYLFECSWFFSALFIADIIQHLMVKNHINIILQGIIWVFLLTTTIYISCPSASAHSFHNNNFFHYKNGLCMGIFIWVGYALKRTGFWNNILRYGALTYLILIVLYKFTGIIHPVVFTHETMMAVCDIPLYLLFALSGSCLFIYAAKLLRYNAFLEHFGKNSVVVYGMQFAILKVCVLYTGQLMPLDNSWETLLFFALVFTEAIILCAFFVQLFTKTKLKYLIGKF